MVLVRVIGCYLVLVLCTVDLLVLGLVILASDKKELTTLFVLFFTRYDMSLGLIVLIFSFRQQCISTSS